MIHDSMHCRPGMSSMHVDGDGAAGGEGGSGAGALDGGAGGWSMIGGSNGTRTGKSAGEGVLCATASSDTKAAIAPLFELKAGERELVF
jgi:hypothetical protein